MTNFDENDLSGKSDEELKNETFNIVNDVFDTINQINDTSNVKNEERKYNNYQNNYNFRESFNNVVSEEDRKAGVKLAGTVLIVIIAVVFLFILSIFLAIKNIDSYSVYDSDDDESDYEVVYDVEYDTNNDGYLNFEERNTYDLEQAEDYEDYYIINEKFIDKENKVVYFELENRNEYPVDYANINIAFYDEEGNLLEAKNSYIDNTSTDNKVIEEVYYEREFASYQAVVRVSTGFINESSKNKTTNVSVIDSTMNKKSRTVGYTIKNNGSENVSGKVYVIFYDENDNVIAISDDYLVNAKPNKETKGEIYVYGLDRLDYLSYEINVSSLYSSSY